MTIDFNKPVQTRDGRKVRILCTDGPGDYPVIGLVADHERPDCWTLYGKYLDGVGLNSRLDLINEPERVERWHNIYGQRITKVGQSKRSGADADADEGRTGVLRITYEDGKPISVALEDI